MRCLMSTFALVMLTFSFAASAEPDFVDVVHAFRTTTKIHIDGTLDEAVWHNEPCTKFYQQEPNQGEPCSERTELWIAYDDVSIYVAAKMYDSHPDSIVARLSRRDNDVSADAFWIAFDTYHDHRTAYYFGVTAAGTQLDGIFYNDDWSDDKWDAVWESVTKIQSWGWSVEYRIPFSQLRFKKEEQYIFGVNAKRQISRKNEEAFLVYTPRNQSGFVSRFPHLAGIENITPPLRFEALPYVSAKGDFQPYQQGNPFHDGSKYTPNAGIDFKVGLGTNLTLQGSLNPDFGQVEVDPAVVNLSDVESYFEEKRPFFIEGMNIFSFGYGGVNSYWSFNWSNPEIFYSRRIGRTPQRNLPDYDFADIPLAAQIIGAAKLTGKVGSGWNIGWIEAVTRREYGKFDTNGTQWKMEVEPLALYSVARLQRDFNDGKQGVGILATNAQRFFDDIALEKDVSKSSFVGGFDGWTALDGEKKYMLGGWATFSRVQGNPERILAIQENSAHYFQRPDRSYARVDSSATYLQGSAGRFTLNKQKGNVSFNAALGWVSPGFDSHDLGFFSRTDIINYHIETGYRWNEPTRYYRIVNCNVAYFKTNDFGGRTQYQGIWGQVYYQFTNFHSVSIGYDYGFPFYDNYATRGGPALHIHSGNEWNFNYSTNDAKNLYGNGSFYGYESDIIISRSMSVGVTYRPIPSLSFSLTPGYSRVFEKPHWIATEDDPYADLTYGKRYIFANLFRNEFSAQVRLDWIFSPTLSFQVFVQPLFSTGDYTKFSALRKPHSIEFDEYGKNGSSISANTSSDGAIDSYDLDIDGNGPAPSFNISNPDFTTVSLRGSAILRWEYRRGSTVYLVWNHNRFENDEATLFRMKPLLQDLSETQPQSIVMLKVVYWFGV